MNQHAINTIKDYAVADGDKITLTCGQLDRDLYEQVNLLFSRFRGQWKGGKVSAHVFPYPITGQVVIDSIVAGNIPPKNPYDLFPTPDPIIDLMLEMVTGEFPNQDKALRFLEPSAGTGAIARRLQEAYPNATIDCIEIDPINVRILNQLGFAPIHDNFETFVTDTVYDAVVMNPPFAGTTYIDHIVKAMTMVGPHGLTVAIAPSGLAFQQQGKVRRMLAHLHECCGLIEELPAGAFKESGTNIATLLLSIPGDVPERLPSTGYASRRIGNLLMNADNDYKLYEDKSRLIKRFPSVAIDMTDTVTDAKFIAEVESLYNSWMNQNALTFYAILEPWEWAKIASDIALDYGIGVLSQETAKPETVKKPVAAKQKVQRAVVEYEGLPLFA